MADSIKKLSDNEIEHLLNRGVAEVIVREEMVKLLKSGRQLRLKEGFDPSAPDIHLGHVVALKKLRQFQELGHQIVLIVADWTAQIGDPTGVSITRPMLTAEQVRANAETYMQQFFKIVDKDKTEVRWQSEWFGNFGLADVIKLASKFTVAQFLARDDFSKRYAENRPIALTEFIYPLLQAYDSVAVNSDVEFGGTDQKFNFLVGREMQGMMDQHPQQCFMTPLLVGLDGSHKMSKSLGNYIGVDEAPEQIYGKAMSITDDLILTYFELITDVPDGEIAGFKQALDGGENPMSIKKRLARELVTQFHSAAQADEAEAYFARTVQHKEVPDEIPEIKIDEVLLGKIRARTLSEEGMIVSSGEVGKPETKEWIVSASLLLNETALTKSRGEANRLIQQGAVTIDGKKITGDEAYIKIGSIIKAGKRRYIKTV